MGKMKGNSTCHTYSKQGAINHGNIKWDSDNKCEYQRLLKKNRIICILGQCTDCGGKEHPSCPLNKE